MYWPVLVHNSCLLIILCGLTTTSHASDTFDTIVERRSAAAAAAAAATAAATASAASPSASAHVNVPPQTLSPSKISSSTISSSSALPSSSILQSQQHTKNIATSTVYHHGSGSHNIESRNSYTMLSQAMSQAVNHEFSGAGGSGSADGACLVDDFECNEMHDRLGMEAIKSLHKQLDDDDNGNIDLTESDDFLREELKYDSGYEKRHKTFHYNDDTQISVKELWEAWLRSEVHNWTIEQTADWLAQSVQLPQYVEIFQKHKVSGQTLPRLAVHNMHYVSNVLGIRDPIHKQKIALKAMDVVLFGPPRETGTRWKDYILVTLLLSAIIGCWYAYQQNKNAKRHLRRMAKDMEGLQKAENALTEMQKELERARLEQENVATEKLDLERRLKEAPSLSSSCSDLEVQQLKQEIEMLRSELSRAEVELVDHCWTPPPALQQWLQLTYELESKHTLKKRVQAEKQLQLAREACEKLKRKRSSLVGAFVSTHGKSIDDVDRSIVEARNALSEVTAELQERLHRWKQIEMLLGFSVVNNNGIAYLENILYNRNGSGKSSRARLTGSQDELDDESVQGMFDSHGRAYREDSSTSDDGGDTQSAIFVVGDSNDIVHSRSSTINSCSTITQSISLAALNTNAIATNSNAAAFTTTPTTIPTSTSNLQLNSFANSNAATVSSSDSLPAIKDEMRQSTMSLAQDRIVPLPRIKKLPTVLGGSLNANKAPQPPPRRATSHQSLAFSSFIRSQSADVEPLESPSSAIVSSTTQLDDSTDSSSIDDEHKKRRRKLHFPFGKKSQKAKYI